MVVNKRFYIIILSVIVLTGFLATSLIGYFVAKDSLTERLQQEMLPLTSDNIYSEIQRDLLQPLLISSLLTHAERLQHEGYLRREEAVEVIRTLAAAGTPIKEIVRRTGRSRKRSMPQRSWR